MLGCAAPAARTQVACGGCCARCPAMCCRSPPAAVAAAGNSGAARMPLLKLNCLVLQAAAQGNTHTMELLAGALALDIRLHAQARL